MVDIVNWSYSTVKVVERWMLYMDMFKPSTKIDKKNIQLKKEILNQFRYIGYNMKHLYYQLESLPVNDDVNDLYMDLGLSLCSDMFKFKSVFQIVWTKESIYFSYHPSRRRLYKPTYEFKRNMITELNKCKRGLNKVIRIIDDSSIKVSKLELENKTYSRSVLNSNTWMKNILENKYEQAVEITESTQEIIPVEKQVIKLKTI